MPPLIVFTIFLTVTYLYHFKEKAFRVKYDIFQYLILEEKNEIKDYKEILCSRFSDIVSLKIDFTAFVLRRYHPPAWELSEASIKAGSEGSRPAADP